MANSIYCASVLSEHDKACVLNHIPSVSILKGLLDWDHLAELSTTVKCIKFIPLIQNVPKMEANYFIYYSTDQIVSGPREKLSLLDFWEIIL